MADDTKHSLKLALAQLNPVVGDIEGNLEKVRKVRGQLGKSGAELIVFTELFLTGYPLEDLVLKPALQKAAREALRGACPRHGRWRARHPHGPSVGRGAVRL